MKCNVCFGKMRKTKGSVELRYNKQLIIIDNVDYFSCETCGERIFSEDTVTNIFKKVKSKSHRKYIKVPVYA